MSFNPMTPDDDAAGSDQQPTDAINDALAQETIGNLADSAITRGLDASAQSPATELPHPNFGFAVIWCGVLLISQIAVGIAVSIAIALYAWAKGQLNPTEFRRLMESLSSVVLMLGTLLTLAVALLICGILFRRQATRLMGWRGCSAFHWLLTLALVLPQIVVASEVVNWAAKFLPQVSTAFFVQFATQPWAIVFFSACLLPALGEELFFRGFLSRGLVARHGVIFGTALTAALFAVIHVDPVQACGAFFLGLMLQFVFLTTRSLMAPIVIHMLNNTVAFAIYKYQDVLSIPGLSPSADGDVNHTPILVLVLAVTTSVGLAALFFQTRIQWRLPDATIWTPGYVSAERPPAELAARAISCRPSFWLAIITIACYTSMVWSLLAVH